MTRRLAGIDIRRPRGLTVRVIVLLSLVLLPLGLFAVVQAREYEREATRRSELALLALTERGAAAQAELVEHALGATLAIASAMPELDARREFCAAQMAALIAAEPRFALAAYVRGDGTSECNSTGEAFDVGGTPAFDGYLEDPSQRVRANPFGEVSGEWVVIVRAPVYVDEQFAGAATISIPQRHLSRAGHEKILRERAARPLQLITFNRAGEVLSRRAGPDSRGEDDLPQTGLSDLARPGARAFTEESRAGLRRTYAVTPIVPGQVFALGVWEPEQPRADVAALLFPAMMWAASLIVASIAMHRLVIVHIQSLRGKMRTFGRSRRLDDMPVRLDTPAEFREMDAEFMAMAENVLRDEAQLEDAVREKNILLKEIHHRVKNNLQLLSSITAMKRRKADTAEARSVLRSLQDRILSLAAIHRNLYLARDMSAVDARRLIEDIAAQAGLTPGQGRLDLNVEEVQLVPQQAVPLSLLVAEGFAMGAGDDGGAQRDPVSITFAAQGEGMVTLDMIAGRPAARDDGNDAAISANLMAAFADQLGGNLHTETDETGQVRLSVTFRALDAVPDALDY